MITLQLTDAEAHLLYRAAIRGLKGERQVDSDEATRNTLTSKLLDMAVGVVAAR